MSSDSKPPTIDPSTGKMLNPHNPEFLTKKPWYLSGDAAEDAPTLDHQQAASASNEELTLTEAERVLEQQRREQQAAFARSDRFSKGQWVEALKKKKKPFRIAQVIQVHANKNLYDLQFEDGTVENKVKPSFIRVTKSGSRATAATSSSLKETYDSKRDAYHGYDRDSHNAKLTQKYEEREAIRRKIREENKKDSGKKGEDDSDFDDSEDDDDDDKEFVQRDADAVIMTTRLARQGGVGGAQMKVTARNLRIREDTAKYLRNLDPNSAYYDPKSRSMRDNPNPEVRPEDAEFAGDNFARASGDAIDMADTQMFAWDAAKKGVALHPQANPSQAEMLKKEFKSKESSLKMQRKKAVLDKYGGEEYLDGSGGLASAVDKKESAGASTITSDERKLRFGVTAVAEEYSRDGRLVKSAGATVKQQARESKYEEDIYQNGHTTVWGSYFHKGAFMWGYADDHSLMKSSYCTGENGRIANDEAHEMQYGTGKAGSAALAKARGMLKAAPQGSSSVKQGLTGQPVSRSKYYGEADPNADVDKEKLEEALKRASGKQQDNADKKRKYHSMNAEVEMTDEDMEAYRLLKDRKSDPMANINTDELLEYKK